MKYSIKKNEIKKVSEKLQYLTNEAIKIADRTEEKSEIHEEADDWFSLGVGGYEALEYIQEFEKFIEKNKLIEEENMEKEALEKLQYLTDEAIKIADRTEEKSEIHEEADEWFSLGVGACEALEHIQEFEKFIEKNKIEEEKKWG